MKREILLEKLIGAILENKGDEARKLLSLYVAKRIGAKIERANKTEKLI